MEKIRNIAVIAHVDHGKTTMVDELLKQSGTFNEHQNLGERVMDSNDIERERGITILSKNTAIRYKDTKINIIDTPGHADFGGEVERVLKMVDGVLLLVDAQEGVMPQTKFVVKKALSLGLRPIVVVNKIDKPAGDPDRVINEIFDLFVALDANDEQLEFPVVYAAAKNGYAKLKLSDENKDMQPLFETILAHVPAPSGSDENPLQLQVFTLDYDNYVGKIGIARIFNGKIAKNQNVMLAKADGTKTTGRISKLIGFMGLDRIDINEAGTGDIVAIAGFDALDVGDSVVDPNNPHPLDPLHIEEPTLSVVFSVNDGPLAGTEGKHVTSNKIDERLANEMKTNIAMKYENIGEGKFKVSGRGELQITILAENMRREGYEAACEEAGITVLDALSGHITTAGATKTMEDLLNAYPDQIDIVLCHNDDTAIGAMNACKSAGVEDMIIVGFDGNASAVDLILAGEMVKATVAQQPYEMGYQAVEAALKAINGETVEEVINAPVTVVTAENGQEYLDSLAAMQG